jgi:hypothetical protein
MLDSSSSGEEGRRTPLRGTGGGAHGGALAAALSPPPTPMGSIHAVSDGGTGAGDSDLLGNQDGNDSGDNDDNDDDDDDERSTAGAPTTPLVGSSPARKGKHSRTASGSRYMFNGPRWGGWCILNVSIACREGSDPVFFFFFFFFFFFLT